MHAVCMQFQFITFEYMFIRREHEVVHSSSGSAEKQAQENYREPRSIETPQPPNPVALSQVYVTVGIDGFCPVSEAVDEVCSELMYNFFHNDCPQRLL